MSKISRLSSQYQDPASMSFGPPRLGPGNIFPIPYPVPEFYIRLLQAEAWAPGVAAAVTRSYRCRLNPLRLSNKSTGNIIMPSHHVVTNQDLLVSRFAGLLDDDGDAIAPPASVYHGRASEPAVSLSRAMNGSRERDNNLRGGSRSRDNSR